MAAESSENQTKPEESQPESSPARQTRTVQEDPRYIRRMESSPAFIWLEQTRQTPGYFKQTSQKSSQATTLQSNWIDNWKQIFPEMNIFEASFPLPTFMYLWEIYRFPGSVCLFCCSRIDWPILGIYKSFADTQIHLCGNWERGGAVSILGIHKLDLLHSVGLEMSRRNKKHNLTRIPVVSE